MVLGVGNDQRFDWEDELERPWGHPLVATALGIVVTGVLVIIVCSVMTVKGHAATAAGLALLVAAAVWAGAWFLDLRRTTTGWSILAGVAFAGTAVIVVAGAMATAAVAMRMDVATMAKIRVDAQGEPYTPPGAPAGPATRLGMTYLREMLAERHKREALLIAKLGLDRLTDASALIAAPPLLKDCDRFARAKPELLESDRRIQAVIARFRKGLDTVIDEPALHDAVLKGIDKSASLTAPNLREMSAVQQAELDQAGGLCRLLARRNWTASGAMFMFTSPADLGAFNRAMGPWNELVRRQQAVTEGGKEQMRKSGRFDDPSKL